MSKSALEMRNGTFFIAQPRRITKTKMAHVSDAKISDVIKQGGYDDKIAPTLGN